MSGTVTALPGVGKDAALRHYLKPIEPFMRDEALNEIAINRPGEIWTEGRAGWVRHDAPAVTFQACLHIARLIATFNDKTITAETPVVSGSLPDGERVQVVMPPAAQPGTVSITIRKPSLLDFSLDELQAQGAFDRTAVAHVSMQPFEHELVRLLKEHRVREFLDLAVRMQRNILIVGKTGSGKTTVTKSLIQSIPAHERLITIEDVHELVLRAHANRVHLFYGREDEGGSKVSAKQALASCLRMKPDRILLAELRGDEAWDYIKSINTGHPGSISTMHANGAYEAFEQLTALIKDSRAGAHLPTEYVRARLFATIDVVLYYHERKLREVYYEPERRHAEPR